MTLIASATVAGPNGGTTGNVNTTGATLLVAAIHYVGTPTMADSKSNTWVPLTARGGVDPSVRIYYVANPTVSSGSADHNFTGGGSSTFQVLAVQAHSGIATVSPFDQENGASGAGFDNTNAQPGSITPSENNELIVCCFGDAFTQTLTISESMTITDQTQLAGGNNYSGAFAYKYQTTAAAINPLWGFTGSAGGSIAQASFKAAAAATASYPGRRPRPALTYR